MTIIHNQVSPSFAPISQPRDGGATLANGSTTKWRQTRVKTFMKMYSHVFNQLHGSESLKDQRCKM